MFQGVFCIFYGAKHKSMRFPDHIRIFITETDNIYDLIGNCYGLLCESISNPASFINDYLSGTENSAGEIEINPNLPILNQFSEDIIKEIQHFKASHYNEFLTHVRLMIRKISLKPYLDTELNNMTIIFALLSGIDAGARTWKMHKFSAGLGPLDVNGKTGYRVYFSSHRTMHFQYVQGVGRERQHESDFASQFETFRFINTGTWRFRTKGPRILHIPQIWASMEKPKTILRIAVIPGHSEKNFEFCKKRASGVEVSYQSIDQEKTENKISKSLETAIQAECDIIVLPEYILSPQIYDAVRCKIRTEYFRRGAESMPQVIFAGTMWTENNNVLKILDACGDEIGNYYKYSPFTRKARAGYGYDVYESLEEPGKMCDLISVEGWGVFLPAVCRDAIDGEYTEEIAKLLLPFFLVICAWSPSVASFEPRQAKLANSYFISSILANSCSAVNMEKSQIGNASIIQKQETIAGMYTLPICRDECMENCESSACIYIAEYDFSYNEEKNTQLHVYRL